MKDKKRLDLVVPVVNIDNPLVSNNHIVIKTTSDKLGDFEVRIFRFLK